MNIINPGEEYTPRSHEQLHNWYDRFDYQGLVNMSRYTTAITQAQYREGKCNCKVGICPVNPAPCPNDIDEEDLLCSFCRKFKDPIPGNHPGNNGHHCHHCDAEEMNGDNDGQAGSTQAEQPEA